MANSAAKDKSLAKTLVEIMAGYADLTSVHQCMDALNAAQDNLEFALDGHH